MMMVVFCADQAEGSQAAPGVTNRFWLMWKQEAARLRPTALLLGRGMRRSSGQGQHTSNKVLYPHVTILNSPRPENALGFPSKGPFKYKKTKSKEKN